MEKNNVCNIEYNKEMGIIQIELGSAHVSLRTTLLELWAIQILRGQVDEHEDSTTWTFSIEPHEADLLFEAFLTTMRKQIQKSIGHTDN